MGRVPDLIPDSDTGAAEYMVTKTVDRLTADTVATGTHHTKLAADPKGDHKGVVSQSINPECRVSLEPVTAFRTEAVGKTLLADGEVIR